MAYTKDIDGTGPQSQRLVTKWLMPTAWDSWINDGNVCANECPHLCADEIAGNSSFRNALLATMPGSTNGSAANTKVVTTCEQKYFNILYNGNGNTAGTRPASPTTCLYGGSCVAPSNTYTKTGYTFAGWKCSSSTGSCASEIYSPGADISSAVNLAAAGVPA
jgi:hypothetical protein